MTRRGFAISAVALSLSLVLGGCSDDSSSSDESSPTTRRDGDGVTVDAGSTATEVTVSVTDSGIEMPDELEAGAVKITLQSGEDINFSKVVAGTTEEQLRQALARTIQGGAIPDFIEEQTGVVSNRIGATTTLLLSAGDYIAWAERPSGESEGGTDTAPEAEPIMTKPVKVTGGETGELPDTGGNLVTARDYSFDVDLEAGAREFEFRNEGPDQFHHVILVNFGDLEPSVVEENLVAFLETEEDDPAKPPFDKLNHDELQAGGSAVLSPGQAATALGKISAGNTYAALCFIQDRTGGPPHALAKGMRTVFTVE